MKLTRYLFSISSFERLLNNIIGAVLLLGIMVLIVCDVTGRYFFHAPVQGTLEITEFVMVAVVFLTLSHTQAIKAHIKVDLLTERISPRTRLILALITYFLGLMLFVLIAWEGALSALDAWEIGEVTDGLIPFPTLPAKLTIPIGSFVLCLRFIVDIVNSFKELAKKDVS